MVDIKATYLITYLFKSSSSLENLVKLSQLTNLQTAITYIIMVKKFFFKREKLVLIALHHLKYNQVT